MSNKRNKASESPKASSALGDKDDEDFGVTCDDEFVKGLEILMNKAKYDLKRSESLLGKVNDYKELCEMTVQELNICQTSYMKVCSYAYKMRIINADPEIRYASAIGDAVRITTDKTDVTASLPSTDLVKMTNEDKL
jgi:hypothetical protein